MVPSSWIVPVLLVVAKLTTGFILPSQHNEESLRSALDAVVRKQRSLDTDAQEYYNELRHSFDHHNTGNPRIKLERELQRSREMNGEDEETEFLPPFENGQLETVGDNYQDSNDKLLEKALFDYLENTPEQIETVPTSLFRERERSANRKRGNNAERTSFDSEDPNSFFEERRGSIIYNGEDLDENGYPETVQELYDRNGGPMSWGELLAKQDSSPKERGESRQDGDTIDNDDDEFIDRNQDQSLFYLLPAERRNVNGRYPIGRELRTYQSLIKRYPITKRSPKPFPAKKQITDPKVAQDLGALFGTQSTVEHNQTHDHDHKHDRDHDHDHEHNHDHDHDHDHEHNDKDHKDNDHNHNHEHDNKQEHSSTSEVQKITPPSTGQKENITKEKAIKPKGKSIEVRKKSIDWSQYFGIDRRRKKATFVAKQGTQNQDDEWMLQRYYENMAENLEPTESEKENNDQKDKLEQMDRKLKNIKDLIIETLQNTGGVEDGADMQKVKDKVMARMAAAYTLEKMRKAISELRNSAAAQREAHQKASNASPNNLTSNYRGNDGTSRSNDKRNNLLMNEDEGTEKVGTCPMLDLFNDMCSINLPFNDGILKENIVESCIAFQMCKTCGPEETKNECSANYAMDVSKICEWEEKRIGLKVKKACISATLLLTPLLRPQNIMKWNHECHENEACSQSNRYRFLYRR